MKDPVWGIDSCYKILDLKKKCSVADVKKAYRRLAFKYHPDRNKEDPLAERKFILTRLAYEWVMFDKKKKVYSQFGKEFSPYAKTWEEALHSEEFKDWDKKNPELSKALYKGAKGAGHVIDMGGSGYFDEQGFYHDHPLKKKGAFPSVPLDSILSTYKKRSLQKKKSRLSLRKRMKKESGDVNG